jgi:hypothetical protein
MSDLADAVFGGQLMGHVIAGEQLTTSVINDAALTADLASGLVVDGDLSSIEEQILQAKVSQQVVETGNYSIDDAVMDQQQAQLHGELVDYL